MSELVLPPTEEEIRDMPAVVLVGARDSGKSRTLAGWSTLTTVFEVQRPMAGPPTVSRVLQASPTAFRSSSVREYVVGDAASRRLRVIDLPGEALETTNARRAENLPTASDQYLADLVRLDPLVSGVIVCSAAPQGDAAGFVPDFDLARVQMHGHPPDEAEVKTRLEWALGFVRTFLLSPNVRRLHGRRLKVAVQVNFADLVRFAATGLASIREGFSALLPDDAPELGWRAVARRLKVYPRLSDASLELLPWLAQALEGHDAIAPFVYVQANEPMVHAPGLLGGWAHLTGFLYLLDQTLGRRRLRKAKLRLVGAALALLVAAPRGAGRRVRQAAGIRSGPHRPDAEEWCRARPRTCRRPLVSGGDRGAGVRDALVARVGDPAGSGPRRGPEPPDPDRHGRPSNPGAGQHAGRGQGGASVSR